MLADPAFYSIKVPVHDLVTRLILARERAEASISEARTALQQFSASTTARCGSTSAPSGSQAYSSARLRGA